MGTENLRSPLAHSIASRFSTLSFFALKLHANEQTYTLTRGATDTPDTLCSTDFIPHNALVTYADRSGGAEGRGDTAKRDGETRAASREKLLPQVETDEVAQCEGIKIRQEYYTCRQKRKRVLLRLGDCINFLLVPSFVLEKQKNCASVRLIKIPR